MKVDVSGCAAALVEYPFRCSYKASKLKVTKFPPFTTHPFFIMGYQHSIPSSTESNEPSRKWSAVISGLRRGLRTLDPSYTPFGPSKNKRAYGKLSFKLVPQSKPAKNPATAAYKAFLGKFPEYKLTSILDDLREEDFSRLDRKGETYVDYMGGSVYPESLVRTYAAFLCNNVLGNTHSVSNR
jgi:molybdenum cofactor sulfurtransferase